MGEREGATAEAVKEEEQVNREKGGEASQWGKGKGQQPGR